jgi:hypothetical protein
VPFIALDPSTAAEDDMNNSSSKRAFIFVMLTDNDRKLYHYGVSMLDTNIVRLGAHLLNLNLLSFRMDEVTEDWS